MTRRKLRIIHVGNMANKGTQALISTDISVIKKILEDVTISITTTECYYSRDFSQKLDLPISSFPPIIDIPYDKVDSRISKLGLERNSLRYKMHALAGLLNMFKQSVFSVFSSCLIKIGLNGFPGSESLRDLRECDFVVSYSNENFKEVNSELPINLYWIISWWTMLFSRTWEVLTAQFFRKPVVMFPNSVGPFRSFLGRFLAKLALRNCLCLLVREPISYQMLKSLGVKSPQFLTSDTALLFESGNKINEKFENSTVGVCAGVYSFVFSDEQIRNYVISHARALDAAIEKHDFDVIFLPHGISGFPNDDFEICTSIASEMKHSERTKTIKVDNAKDFKSHLDKMDMVISSKMHPLVLSVSGTVPVVCVAYDHKQIGFMEHLDMPDCTISINQISPKRLKAKIDFVWENRERLRETLRVRIPSMKRHVTTSIRKAIFSCLKESELQS